MANFTDSYLENIIKAGDEGSAFLAAQFAHTLNNNEFIQPLSTGMHGFVVARAPHEFDVAVHVSGGESRERDFESYGASLVEHLVAQAKSIDAIPIGMVDVVDANSADKDQLLRPIAKGMAAAANNAGVAIMNGELAILGNRVRDVNLTGVMISLVPKGLRTSSRPYFKQTAKGTLIVFNHEGETIYMNADGVGTKTEFHERLGKYGGAVRDFAAMNLDDAVKRAARVVALAGVVERNGAIDTYEISRAGQMLGNELGIATLFSHEPVGDRVRSYRAGVPAFNISGAAVSLIDEERLTNMPRPAEDDYLIAIRGKPNPRSNGISDKRRIMIEWLGEEWHTTKIGKEFMEFLAEPSVVLYPVFKELLDTEAASSVFHMSGGAYKGKLAAPLAKEGLAVLLGHMFQPDKRELDLATRAGFSPEVAYAKWPMGTDGFVSTKNPARAQAIISKFGLDSRVVGRLFLAPAGARGVALYAQGHGVEYSY